MKWNSIEGVVLDLTGRDDRAVNDGFYLFLFLLQGGTLYENYCIFLIESGEIK